MRRLVVHPRRAAHHGGTGVAGLPFSDSLPVRSPTSMRTTLRAERMRRESGNRRTDGRTVGDRGAQGTGREPQALGVVDETLTDFAMAHHRRARVTRGET